MNADLNNLAEEYWQDELAASPTQALMLGIHDYDELMDDASREAEDARIAQLREYAKAAEAIEPSGLSAQDQITREVLMFEAGTRADLLEMREAELAVNHAMGIQAMLPVIFPQLPIDEPEHAAALLKKYAASGPWFDQMTDRLRSGVAAGRTPVAGTVEKTVAQIDEHLSAAPEKSVFMNVRTPGAFTEEEAAAWRGVIRISPAPKRKSRLPTWPATLPPPGAANSPPSSVTSSTPPTDASATTSRRESCPPLGARTPQGSVTSKTAKSGTGGPSSATPRSISPPRKSTRLGSLRSTSS